MLTRCVERRVSVIFAISPKRPSGLSGIGGLDYWTGILDWNTGLEYWTGILKWPKLL